MGQDFDDIANKCRNDNEITVHYAGNISNGMKLSIKTTEVPQWLWTWMVAEGGVPIKAYSATPIKLTIQIPDP